MIGNHFGKPASYKGWLKHIDEEIVAPIRSEIIQ